MGDLPEKLRLYLNRCRSSATKANKSCILNKFFTVTGKHDNFDEFDVLKFLDWAQNNYKGYSKQQVFQTIKWFCKTFNFEFPNIPPPEINIDELTNVPLPKEDVIKMIKINRFLNPYQKGLVALSTTYGMRAKEMNSVEPDDIKEDRIFVRTAKSGRDTWRWMAIPEEIKPVLMNFKEAITYETYPRQAVFQTFHFVCKIADIKTEKRAGWHSIRRRLIIELTKTGLQDNTIVRFMRWKRKDALTNILYRYRQSEPDEELMESIDKVVFRNHLFLRVWRETNV